MTNHKQAIVTFATGQKYLKSFNETFRPSVERFAKQIDTELIVIEEFIRPSSRHTFWQRLLMFSHPQVSQYDKILMVDADIYITKHAKDIFAAVGDKPWGIVKNNAYDIPRLAITDLYYYNDCPTENRPTFAANVGMYVISKSYQSELEKIYDEYHLKESRGYEAGPLCYFLFNEGKGIMLPTEFNTIVVSYIEKYGCALSSILAMYDSASFIHFAANKWYSVFIFIKWFDTTENKWAKRIVRWFGQKKFDFITAPAFRFFQRLVGSYNYRFKKFFS